MSWSDVRKGKPRAAEYHLNYSSNAVTEMMQPGDRLFLALQRDGTIPASITLEAFSFPEGLRQAPTPDFPTSPMPATFAAVL